MMPACTQGDDYVDWVGLSLYHFGTTFPYDQNVLPEAQKFTSTVSLLLARVTTCLACFRVCQCICSLVAAVSVSQPRFCLARWDDSV